MKKSLNFKKEIVANLNNVELTQVQGGATFDGQACANTVESCVITLDCPARSLPKHCLSFHTEEGNTCGPYKCAYM
ncbi:MAG: class I lanthipeptide [Hyphomicrobiales bacterium]